MKAEVLAQDAPELALDQKAIISGEVLGQDELIGTLGQIHPQAVEKLSELGVIQRRVPVEITLDRRPPNMRPGYPVEVEIITAETIGLALPLEAVFTPVSYTHLDVYKRQDPAHPLDFLPISTAPAAYGFHGNPLQG